MPTESPFDCLNFPYQHELTAFGENWCGPEKYKNWEKTLVAEYKKPFGSDGQDVKVYCTAAPARFYELEVQPGPDSVGRPQDGYRVTFGSGQAEMAVMIAKAVADGMIGFEPLEGKNG